MIINRRPNGYHACTVQSQSKRSCAVAIPLSETLQPQKLSQEGNPKTRNIKYNHSQLTLFVNIPKKTKEESKVNYKVTLTILPKLGVPAELIANRNQ
jgi:L-lactate utilization protein LutB